MNLIRCDDGLCGALDCPRCNPSCNKIIKCSICDLETIQADAFNNWFSCNRCDKFICPQCICNRNFLCDTCRDY